MNTTWWVVPGDLDEDQKQVISLPLNGKYLVTGPPGSGKTNLLLLRATYMVRSGLPNIIVLTFNRTLRDFMTSGAHLYGFSGDKITTSHGYMRRLLRQHDNEVKAGGDFENQRQVLVEASCDLVARKRIRNVFEAVFLDEAQDYLPKEVELFCRLGKRVFAVADSRQKIYEGSDSVSVLETEVNTTMRLRYHYRNGLMICRLADGIAKESDDYEALAPTSQYNEELMPSSVDVDRQDSVGAQAALIAGRISRQLEAYPEDYIGVVCPRHDELHEMVGHIMAGPMGARAVAQERNSRFISFDHTKPVIMCTLHAAKGLEFRALHLAGLDGIKSFPKQRNMTFTGVTRAKTSLNLYYSQSMPGYLEQALANLEPPPHRPNLEDVFGLEDH